MPDHYCVIKCALFQKDIMWGLSTDVAVSVNLAILLFLFGLNVLSIYCKTE